MENNNHYNDEFTKLFFDYAKKMMANSKMNQDTSITPENVYQPAHKANRDILFEIIKMAHLPGSTILGAENLKKLYDLAQQGKSAIIFMEHLSNLDVPSMFVRFYDQPDEKLKEIFEKIIFIAGVKLNENPLVKLYTEMFSRVVLVPLTTKEKTKEDVEKLNLSRKINIRTTRMIKELRNQGYIFLMFPSGTRYRPWKPETKRPIKETASYLTSFDCFCCASINGCNMLPKEHEDMTREQFKKDIIVFNFGEVQDSKEFLKMISEDNAFKSISDKEQSKQYIADKITERIDRLNKISAEYIKGLNK
jgi:glycerol-3-phosphate O-acyltransferase